MVRPLPHDRTRARRDRRRDGREGQDREAQCRREPEDRIEIRRDVDPDPDDLQGRRDGFAPGRRRAEAKAAAVDFRCGLICFTTEICGTAGAMPAVLLYLIQPVAIAFASSFWPLRRASAA